MESRESTIQFEVQSGYQSSCVFCDSAGDIVCNSKTNNINNSENDNENSDSCCETMLNSDELCDKKTLELVTESPVGSVVSTRFAQQRPFRDVLNNNPQHQADHVEEDKRLNAKVYELPDEVNVVGAKVALKDTTTFINASTSLSPMTATSALPCLYTPSRVGASLDHFDQTALRNYVSNEMRYYEMSVLDTTGPVEKQELREQMRSGRQKIFSSDVDRNVALPTYSHSRLADDKNGGCLTFCGPVVNASFFKSLRNIFKRNQKNSKNKMRNTCEEDMKECGRHEETMEAVGAMEGRNLAAETSFVCGQDKKLTLDSLTPPSKQLLAVAQCKRREEEESKGKEKEKELRHDGCNKQCPGSNYALDEKLDKTNFSAKLRHKARTKKRKGFKCHSNDNTYEPCSDSLLEEETTKRNDDDDVKHMKDTDLKLRETSGLPAFTQMAGGNTPLVVKKPKEKTEAGFGENHDIIKRGKNIDDTDSCDKAPLLSGIAHLASLDNSCQGDLSNFDNNSFSPTHLSVVSLNGPQAATLPKFQQCLFSLSAGSTKRDESCYGCGSSREASVSGTYFVLGDLQGGLNGRKLKDMRVTGCDSGRGDNCNVANSSFLCKNSVAAKNQKSLLTLGNVFKDPNVFEEHAERTLPPPVHTNGASYLIDQKGKTNSVEKKNSGKSFACKVPTKKGNKKCSLAKFLKVEQGKKNKRILEGHVPREEKFICSRGDDNGSSNGGILRCGGGFVATTGGSYAQIAARRNELLKRRMNYASNSASRGRVNYNSEEQKSDKGDKLVETSKCHLFLETPPIDWIGHYCERATGLHQSNTDSENGVSGNVGLMNITNEFASRYLPYSGLTWREFKTRFYQVTHPIPDSEPSENVKHFTETTSEKLSKRFAALASLLRPSCAACGPNDRELQLLNHLLFPEVETNKWCKHTSRDWLYEPLPPELQQQSANKKKTPFEELGLSTTLSMTSTGCSVPIRTATVLSGHKKLSAHLTKEAKLKKKQQNCETLIPNKKNNNIDDIICNDNEHFNNIGYGVHKGTGGDITPSVYSPTSSNMKSAFSRVRTYSTYNEDNEEYKEHGDKLYQQEEDSNESVEKKELTLQ